MSKISNEINLLTAGIDLSIIAKYTIHGFLIGMHTGTRRGTGTEFSQYRSYQPGDDIRQIDWKMYARSDRYYIKESEIETSVIVRFFLDSSASMLYEESGFTRFRFASLLTAAIGTLAHRQGDGIALHIVSEKERFDLNPKRGENQLKRFYHLLETAKCQDIWPQTLEWLPDSINPRKRELWIICSDMLDGADRWRPLARFSNTLGNELQFLQILGEKERSLSLENLVTVQDPESGRKLNIRTSSVREEYLENFNRYQQELADAVSGKRNDFETFTMNTPVSDALRIFLKRREML